MVSYFKFSAFVPFSSQAYQPSIFFFFNTAFVSYDVTKLRKLDSYSDVYVLTALNDAEETETFFGTAREHHVSQIVQDGCYPIALTLDILQ